MAGVLMLPWLVILPTLSRNRSTETSAERQPVPSATKVVFQLPSGPWGEIEAREITIAVPEEFVWSELPEDFSPRWLFTGFTRERLAEFFRAVPLSNEQRHDLLRPSEWRMETNGVLVLPKVETVLGLSADVRARIYAQLMESWDEQSQRFAVPLRPGELQELFASSRVPAATQDMVYKLLYPRGEVLMFGDMMSALAATPAPEDRHELVRALAQHRTYLLRLRVPPKARVDSLVNYWSTGVRHKDLRPILESLARVKDGGWIDVMHLLPPMPRRRLYTYPYVSLDPVEGKRDCHWTSVNFFKELPDDRFTDAATTARYIRENYEVITSPSRLGDVIILVNHEETAVHSAVYVASGMVFCKNGGHYSTPWMFQTIEEMLLYYNSLYSVDGGVQLRVYRRRLGAQTE